MIGEKQCFLGETPNNLADVTNKQRVGGTWFRWYRNEGKPMSYQTQTASSRANAVRRIKRLEGWVEAIDTKERNITLRIGSRITNSIIVHLPESCEVSQGDTLVRMGLLIPYDQLRVTFRRVKAGLIVARKVELI